MAVVSAVRSLSPRPPGRFRSFRQPVQGKPIRQLLALYYSGFTDARRGEGMLFRMHYCRKSLCPIHMVRREIVREYRWMPSMAAESV